ncbi:hypothetical protein K469DRAFT_687289 [Zopfia rhizophila CBS 207.26]|uniref:Uncharacterized protein n=1 Tax=Zopfia rhizophila CBS 207.26 TaxID=1314779 RepID=A0A6A6E5N9_9PEZI|nr:hypothetical protein K469DRAFT_687289 [Zopfia rhizophila CBS 207.26]
MFRKTTIRVEAQTTLFLNNILDNDSPKWRDWLKNDAIVETRVLLSTVSYCQGVVYVTLKEEFAEARVSDQPTFGPRDSDSLEELREWGGMEAREHDMPDELKVIDVASEHTRQHKESMEKVRQFEKAHRAVWRMIRETNNDNPSSVDFGRFMNLYLNSDLSPAIRSAANPSLANPISESIAPSGQVPLNSTPSDSAPSNQIPKNRPSQEASPAPLDPVF